MNHLRFLWVVCSGWVGKERFELEWLMVLACGEYLNRYSDLK